jgi:hypothetical protein
LKKDSVEGTIDLHYSLDFTSKILDLTDTPTDASEEVCPEVNGEKTTYVNASSPKCRAKS